MWVGDERRVERGQKQQQQQKEEGEEKDNKVSSLSVLYCSIGAIQTHWWSSVRVSQVFPVRSCEHFDTKMKEWDSEMGRGNRRKKAPNSDKWKCVHYFHHTFFTHTQSHIHELYQLEGNRRTLHEEREREREKKGEEKVSKPGGLWEKEKEKRARHKEIKRDKDYNSERWTGLHEIEKAQCTRWHRWKYNSKR